MVFAEALEEYTDLELAWLQRLYETRAPAAQGTLSLQLITDMSAWNREVTGIVLWLLTQHGSICASAGYRRDWGHKPPRCYARDPLTLDVAADLTDN